MDAPLHPQTQELARRHPEPRAHLSQTWRASVPRAYPIPAGILGEAPLVGSSALTAALDARLTATLTALAPHLAAPPDARWPHRPAPDVLAIDVAVVKEPEGWGLRLVELQAFTSVLATAVLLHHAHARLWPELEGRACHGVLPVPGDLQASIGQVVAPSPAGVVLEHRPRRQRTRFDLEATAQLWGLPLVAPRRLVRRGTDLFVRQARRWQPVGHVVNRLIPHHAPNPTSLRALLAPAQATWHSHPAWFYRIDKGLLPDLPLPAAERCARADCWEELGLPPERLVLKALHSYAGRDVHIGVSTHALRALAHPERWVVQPRYDPLPLLAARDGAPLYGEVRCMVALPPNQSPWLMARIVRLVRGGAGVHEHGPGFTWRRRVAALRPTRSYPASHPRCYTARPRKQEPTVEAHTLIATPETDEALAWRERAKGAEARREGLPRTSCPHHHTSLIAGWWFEGYDQPHLAGGPAQALAG